MEASIARTILLSLPLLLAACQPDQGLKTFNTEPEAEITSHSDADEVLEGYTESFRGAVSDPDHSPDELTATWFLDGEVVCESAAPDDDGISLCDVVIPATASQITLEVQDPENAAGSDQVSLAVVPTDAPVAEITSPSEAGVYYSDQLIIFEGTVRDGEDTPDQLVAEWESSLDGVLEMDTEPDSEGTLAGAANLTEGDHFLTLTVTDSTGKNGGDNLTLMVGPPNSAPSCAITAPETNSADEVSTTVVFEGTAEDVDVASDWLAVSWSSDKDGELGTSTPNSSGGVTFAFADLSVNTHLVSMTVTDEVGATCTDDILYSVGTAPEIRIEAPISGDVVDEGDGVRFQASIADGEDTPTDLALSWVSHLDGEFSTQGSDSTGAILFTESTLSIGTHTITATVTDTDGLYAQGVVLLQVNGVPTAPVVELSPDPADTSDDLVVTLTMASTDPDGDPISYTYSWSVDGVPSTSSTSSTLSSTDTSKGQTWTVEVTPNDGISDGPPGRDDLSIDNTVPELADTTLSPDPATESETLSCSPGSASDLDGDTVTYGYVWTVSGSTVGETSSELTGDDFDRGDTVVCTVTPNDGEEDGASVDSNTVTIDNTAPSIDSVSISPDPATAASELSCSYEGYADADDDDDASTYEWLIDGATVGTDSTLSGAFVGGDSVTCTVTPEDGTDTGTALSTSITMDNTAPVLADLSLSPDPAYEADTLVCSPGTITDIDGTSSFTYTYSWSVNGGDPGESSSQLTGDDFSRGDAVTCTATPSDGSDAGDGVNSNTVTIGNTAPEVSSVSIDPDPATAEDVLLCEWSFRDDDGDSDESTLEWMVNGSSAGTDATLSGAFVFGDEVTCTVTANDGTDPGNTDSATLTIENTVPVLTDVTLSPDPAYEADTLSCTPGDITDADGTVGFDTSYAWEVNGIDISETADTLDGDRFDKGDEVVCIVTPGDGDDEGDAVESNTVTIGNTAPTITAALISPDPARTSDDLACAGSGDGDVDGDSVRYVYAWFVNDLENGEASASLDSSEFGVGDTVYCTVTPTDDTDEGVAAVSDTLTIENTAPEITEITLTPSEAFTDDILTASASTSDVDGDSVSLEYDWYVDGSMVATGSGTSLSGVSYFDKDQEVYVVATPSDGADDGAAVISDSIIVSNTPPEAPEVSVDSEESPCSSLELDGSDDYVEFPYSDDFNLGASDFTIEAWAQLDSSSSSNQWLLAFRDIAGTEGCGGQYCHYQIGYQPSTGLGLYLRNDSATGHQYLTTSLPSTETWFHIAGVRSGSGIEVYIDGILVASGSFSGSLVDITDALYIGSEGGARQFWQGAVGPVRISNIARYSSSFTPDEAFTTDSDTLANWGFSEGYGITVADDGTGAHDGTIGDGIWSEGCPSGEPKESLLCSIETESTDPDGDSITYTLEWDVDGVGYTDAFTTEEPGDTISSSEYGAGETWTCTVTPSDGEDDGEPGLGSSTINTPPEAPEISINPGAPVEGEDDLVCVIDTESADVDGDTVSYTFEWDVNGVVYDDATTTSHTSDTVLGSETFATESWTCTATPDDGLESGTSAESSVVISEAAGCGTSTTIDTYNYAGMSYYPIHLDYCTPTIAGPCYGSNTTADQMEAFCQLAGYCEATSWDIDLLASTSCYCYGSGSWSSPCCSGSDNRYFVTSVTCE